MQGHRSRYQIEKYFGAADIFTTLVDHRQYFYIRPFGMAFRFYNYGMYGKDVENSVIPPLYIGYPWLIRGYDNISAGNSNSLEGNTFDISWLSGTRIAVANAELRLPLSGPERLALIKSKWFLADLNLFFDSGLAWSHGEKVGFDMNPMARANDNVTYPVFSTGVSLRVNLFGYLVIEPYYAFPLQNGGFGNGSFGINFIPGW
jgi:outer membrane protein assembly factor BamA